MSQQTTFEKKATAGDFSGNEPRGRLLDPTKPMNDAQTPAADPCDPTETPYVGDLDDEAAAYVAMLDTTCTLTSEPEVLAEANDVTWRIHWSSGSFRYGVGAGGSQPCETEPCPF